MDLWDQELSGIRTDHNMEKETSTKHLADPEKTYENKSFLTSLALHPDLHLLVRPQDQMSLLKCLLREDYSPGIYAWLDMTGETPR